MHWIDQKPLTMHKGVQSTENATERVQLLVPEASKLLCEEMHAIRLRIFFSFYHLSILSQLEFYCTVCL